MKKWEYCHVYIYAPAKEGGKQKGTIRDTTGTKRSVEGDDAGFMRVMKELGDQGWEAFAYNQQPFPESVFFFIMLKRPVES